MFVDTTAESELKNPQIRTKFPSKVIEKASNSIKPNIQKSNPFSKSHCGRRGCIMCKIECKTIAELEVSYNNYGWGRDRGWFMVGEGQGVIYAYKADKESNITKTNTFIKRQINLFTLLMGLIQIKY